METTNESTRASIHLWKCMGLSNAYFNLPIASIQKNKRTSYIFTNECFREYIQTECYRDSFFTHLKFVFKKKMLGINHPKTFPIEL